MLVSGGGSNMAALLHASRMADCPYEIVLVGSNNPDAGGLKIAAAEGVPTYALPHKGMARAEHDMAMDAAIRASWKKAQEHLIMANTAAEEHAAELEQGIEAAVFHDPLEVVEGATHGSDADAGEYLIPEAPEGDEA